MTDGRRDGADGERGAEDDSENQVVVSLIRYAPPKESGWGSITLKEKEGGEAAGASPSVAVPAGNSFLDLYKVLRPKDYFLPTQTAGWFFTIGGVALNCVHGGVFG